MKLFLFAVTTAALELAFLRKPAVAADGAKAELRKTGKHAFFAAAKLLRHGQLMHGPDGPKKKADGPKKKDPPPQMSQEWMACVDTNCPGAMSHQYPEGWGTEKDVVMGAIAEDPQLAGAVACTCHHCGNFTDMTQWVAYPDACDAAQGQGHAAQYSEIPTEAEVRRIVKTEECTGIPDEATQECHDIVDHVIDVCYPECVGTMVEGPEKEDPYSSTSSTTAAELLQTATSSTTSWPEKEDPYGTSSTTTSFPGEWGSDKSDYGHHSPEECFEHCAMDTLVDMGMMDSVPTQEDIVADTLGFECGIFGYEDVTHDDGSGTRVYQDDEGTPVGDDEQTCGAIVSCLVGACYPECTAGNGTDFHDAIHCFGCCVDHVMRDDGAHLLEICEHRVIPADGGAIAADPGLVGDNAWDQKSCKDHGMGGVQKAHDAAHYCDSNSPEDEPCCGEQDRGEQDKCLREKGIGQGHYCDSNSPKDEPCCGKQDRGEQDKCLQEKGIGQTSLVASAEQRYVVEHSSKLRGAGRILRGKRGERFWLIKKGAGAFRLRVVGEQLAAKAPQAQASLLHGKRLGKAAEDRQEPKPEDECTVEMDCDITTSKDCLKEMIQKCECDAMPEDSQGPCQQIVSDVVDACYDNGDECDKTQEECFDACAEKELKKVLDASGGPGSKEDFSQTVKGAECAKYQECAGADDSGGRPSCATLGCAADDCKQKGENCRNVIDGIFNYCWDAADPGAHGDFSCKDEEGEELHKCFRKCSRKYIKYLSGGGSGTNFLDHAPHVKEDLESGKAFGI